MIDDLKWVCLGLTLIVSFAFAFSALSTSLVRSAVCCLHLARKDFLEQKLLDWKLSVMIGLRFIGDFGDLHLSWGFGLNNQWVAFVGWQGDPTK